jgi:lipopolysaccharide export system protein LptA
MAVLASLPLLPETAPAQGVNRCPINIRRAGTRVERPDPEQAGAIKAFIGGPVTVTCGDATMTGDSAEWRQVAETALMIGNVRYRDTTRTLSSNQLTFYGARDEAVATGDVRLVRTANGATLEGPRVSFTRTPFAGARTVATGRPRMTLPATRGGGGGPETVVDADMAEFVGESEAAARGNVEMTRGDITATAERAQFSEAAARAVMYDSAVIRGQGFDLAGDSIVAGFELGELRSIHAFEEATASGEGFRLAADQIRARLTADQVDVIWAFGQGRSLASSSEFTLAGDSIEFAFREGAADSVSAIGTAAAEQMAPGPSAPAVVSGDPPSAADTATAPAGPPGGPGGLAEPALGLNPAASWIAGDTVRAWFEPDPSGPTEGPATESGSTGNARIKRLRALGDARSFFAAVRDTARSAEASRNYLLGSTIQIDFEAGEPEQLTGTDAIGVYLEPAEEGDSG